MVERLARFGVAAKFFQERAAGAVEIEITAKAIGQRRDQVKRRLRAAEFRNSDGAVERDDGRWRVALKRLVEPIDLRPVGFSRRLRPRVKARNGGLNLIRARTAQAHGFVDQRQPLLDQRAFPFCAILIFQQDAIAIGIEARGDAGVLQQHERQQAHDLRLARIHAQQQAREADGFIAERSTVAGGIGGGIAFVEDEIDHGGD